jgi:hypothetical protein
MMGRRRFVFLSEWRFFASSRRFFAARPGRVGLRLGGGGLSASVNNATKRSRQSSRLRPCVRWRSELIINTPSCVRRCANFSNNNWRCPSPKEWLCATSKRSSARVFTLFTFCPPAPELREKAKFNSAVGIANVLVILSGSMMKYFHTSRGN